jgi:hypothetical protein
VISESDSFQVRSAVFEVLMNNGRVPAHLRPTYRQAVLDLAEARDDRTGGRKERYERAVKNLLPLLNLASPRMPGSPHIERLLAQWRLACSSGPAALPIPQLHEKFEHTYVAQGGETVTEVSKIFRYDNPGPLCHAPYFYSPYMRLKQGDKLYVPFHPRELQYWILASAKLTARTLESLKEEIEGVHASNEEIENFLMLIEGISIVLSVGAAAVEGAALCAKTMKAASAEVREMLNEEALEMLRIEMGKTSAEIFGMAIEASKAPKKGFFFYLRHSPIGWLSPAYWTSLFVWCKTGEPEAFLYGPEGVAHKRIEELTRNARQHVYNLNLKVDFMRAQLDSPIYKHRE